MELDEYPLLNEPNVMLVALQAADRGPAGPNECLKMLKASLRQAGLDLPPDTDPLRRRIRAFYHYLHVAGLVERGKPGRFNITTRGRKALEAYPKGVDTSVLMRFPEFRAFIRRSSGVPDNSYLQEPRKEYEEGYIAGLAGCPITGNPYSPDDIAHLEWENGWCEAQDTESDNLYGRRRGDNAEGSGPQNPDRQKIADFS